MLKDKLKVNIYANRLEMGKAAATAVAERIIKLLADKNEINMVFAAAPSQNEFLEALVNNRQIMWDRINAFHLDEYIGLSPEAPQGFGNFLRRKLFDCVNFKSVNYLNGSGNGEISECERYSKLLKQFPPDIACIGIGENGHLAFNDPPVADFNDKALVKIVELDEVCRKQQVNDGCFTALDMVPVHALTLTIPAIMSAGYIYCMVPGKTKAEAVERTLNGPVSETCPASILRTYEAAELFLDADSAAKI
ncbi:glucosamine-6-phosphate deaminase [Ruminiclostridium cellobioparum]|uniref:6-phosphogluconolactonase/Glucosamine-6-phosphate isomerase/deaminase n=1 Tax=Ruminiclostridium cellobioparum subsp. termitidis CT1112 TaxID=1195236 RepID=S0FLF5_RUMCE|nr:glucosamine-6-phosphate deaminase [Ruminiclostridium cellobioparum]EMS69999.1 6-phosphogluconolactonase/Glucosamine-6- phosphate isomerase/deaminase [Ruminiclostridium cellobioparum subsp. termitidis CT1112]